MKKFRKSLLIILVVLFLLFLGKNVIIKAVVSQGVKAATGLKLNIEKMRVGVFNSRIDIKALTLFNPQQFEDKVMVKIPEIYVDYKLLPFFKQKIYLEEVRLNLNEFIVIKDKDGNVNLDSLKVIKEQKSPQKKAKDKKTMDFQIDKLSLKIGKVIYKDYSKGSKPIVQEYKINIDESYENITNPQALASLIVMKALMGSTLANITDLKGLGNNLSSISKTAVIGTTQAGKEISTQAAESAQKALKETTENVGKTINDTADNLKKLLPFSK